MITFSYKLTSYHQFIEAFGRFLGAGTINNELRLPATVGDGFMRAFSFNGIDALLYNVTVHKDVLLKREKDATEFYTLAYDEASGVDGFKLTISNDAYTGEEQRSSFLYLTSSLLEMDSIFYKDVPLKGLRIFLPTAWMRQYLQIPERDDILEQYIRLKTAGIWQKPIDIDTRTIVQELLSDQQHTLLSYQNRMLRLVEIFFNWLYNEMHRHTGGRPLSRSDILAARKIESLLTTDITILPPTIKEMSRQFAMSESKLKKVFKTVFGLPPYEYYQKNRMLKARQLLLSGNFSIKDVGYTLGYSNLSNFTLAFKKEFGKLPSEVAREGR
jgi:AraC-like DNA-binding protein